MEPKEYLEQLEVINKKIELNLEEVTRIRSLAEKCTSVLNPIKVQTSMSNDNMLNSVMRLAELERETDNFIDRLVDLKREILPKINKVDNLVYYEILFKRYVEFKSLVQIASEKNYSYRQVIRTHNRALEYFKKYM